MIPPAVECRHVSKNFGEVRALDGLSFTVARGEMFALVGPDGAGKSTTIRLLCGILAPTRGAVLVLGREVSGKTGSSHQKNIGYLSQRFSLYGDLSVDENIEFFAEIHGVRGYRERREELLGFTRLTPFRDRLAEHLSGGMKQKLALACTLVHTPEILFLDEPTTGVDPVSRREFWKLLHRLLMDGLTIVLTTPYLDEAERCSHVALLNHGKAMDVDTPAGLLRHVPGEIVEIVCKPTRLAYEVLNSRFEWVQAFGDRLHVVLQGQRRDRSDMENSLRNAGVTIQGIRSVTPSLENVFVALLSGPHAKEV
jgi:ABC-2 type transport system ATP-binding protein